jgi:sugar phosphate isomerase/epimerase
MGGISLGASFRMVNAAAPQAKNTICAFTKPLQSLSFAELAGTIARIGYDGVEIAVRANGHITPDQIEDQLPRLFEALRKHNLELTIMTSDITSLKQPHAARVLRAAAQAGVRTYRLGYYYYDLSRPIPEQLMSFKSSLHDVIAASNDVGLVPMYQNHSGAALMGAPLWDLHELIERYTPEQVGVALDVGHLMIEGGLSWPVQYHLMRPHLRAVYVKDFVWKGHDVEWVPLGEGRVEPKVFHWIRESGFNGPISIHVEYLDGLEGAQLVESNVKAFEHDLKMLRRLMAA